jgi:3-oxoacyl-[acyl-carrier protein] reductase
MIDLHGKVALITGGSRGIGAACACLFARAGADLAITYEQNRNAANSVRRIIESHGQRCRAVRCSVNRRREVDRAVRQTLKEFGRIDILVNNAGIWKYGVIGEMTERQWDETLDVNLKGTFLATNAVVSVMKRQGGGKIINVSSTAGQRGEAFHSHYAAAKGGVIAFTKSIGPELAPHGIIVNCVAPGWVDTDMTADILHDPLQGADVNRGIPRGRPATADEIAGAVLFLASDLANHLVGSTISVNGGSVLSN